jgi:hypothetical protein
VRLTQVAAESGAALRRLVRNRLALALVVLLPAVFFGAVVLVTPVREAWAELPSVPARETPEQPVLFHPDHPPPWGTVIEGDERGLSAVYMGVAALGAVAALLALDLVQKGAAATRRLVLCGRRPVEILAGRLLALLAVLGGAVACTAGLLWTVVDPEQPFALVGALAVGALVHAAFGLLVGAIVRRELVGILLVVLLVNLDAGWLQNPLFYAALQNRFVVEALPAHGPVQAAAVAAFTGRSAAGPVGLGLAWTAALLAAAVAISTARLRVARPGGAPSSGEA